MYGGGTIPNGSEFGRGIYNGEALPSRFWYTQIQDSVLYNSSLANFYSFSADNSFSDTPVETKVKAGLSIFYFGLPLEGYDSAAFDLDDQRDDISDWCYEELNDKLFKWRNKYENDFDLVWACADMESRYIDDLLAQDLLFLFGTIIVILKKKKKNQSIILSNFEL